MSINATLNVPAEAATLTETLARLLRIPLTKWFVVKMAYPGIGFPRGFTALFRLNFKFNSKECVTA